MRRDEQIATRRNTRIHCQHIKGSDELGFRDVSSGSFDKFGSIQFSARVTGQKRIASPGVRAENCACSRIEIQSANGLVLWRVIECARLINDGVQIFRMSRRESVVAAALDMEQF